MPLATPGHSTASPTSVSTSWLGVRDHTPSLSIPSPPHRYHRHPSPLTPHTNHGYPPTLPHSHPHTNLGYPSPLSSTLPHTLTRTTGTPHTPSHPHTNHGYPLTLTRTAGTPHPHTPSLSHLTRTTYHPSQVITPHCEKFSRGVSRPPKPRPSPPLPSPPASSATSPCHSDMAATVSGERWERFGGGWSGEGGGWRGWMEALRGVHSPPSLPPRLYVAFLTELFSPPLTAHTCYLVLPHIATFDLPLAPLVGALRRVGVAPSLELLYALLSLGAPGIREGGGREGSGGEGIYLNINCGKYYLCSELFLVLRSSLCCHNHL